MNKDSRLLNIYDILVNKGLPQYGTVELILNGADVDVKWTDRIRIKAKK